ncbi:hypothetical protein EYS14_00940 [Alteromonadaceae bacterium M269]|nr:hypothetical protein EYS14_00940 [Alteromonadaceae bacterium M269]
MPYPLTQTSNGTSIAEQEYAYATEVRFTKFTSCLGIIAKQGSNLIGIHLVIVSNQETVFDNKAADDVAALLSGYENITVIGKTGFWLDNLEAPYKYLLSRLGNPPTINVEDGIYGGKLNEGKIQLYQNGSYI